MNEESPAFRRESVNSPTQPSLPARTAASLDSSGPADTEPVLLAHAIATGLYALAGAGWVLVEDRRIDIVATVIAFALSTLAVLVARARVTPSGRITWAGVRGAIRDELWAYLEQLAASSDRLPPPAGDATAERLAAPAPAGSSSPPTDPPPGPRHALGKR